MNYQLEILTKLPYTTHLKNVCHKNVLLTQAPMPPHQATYSAAT